MIMFVSFRCGDRTSTKFFANIRLVQAESNVFDRPIGAAKALGVTYLGRLCVSPRRCRALNDRTMTTS